jgi:hypothetical protein
MYAWALACTHRFGHVYIEFGMRRLNFDGRKALFLLLQTLPWAEQGKSKHSFEFGMCTLESECTLMNWDAYIELGTHATNLEERDSEREREGSGGGGGGQRKKEREREKEL